MRFVRATFFIALASVLLAAGTPAAAQPEPALAAFRTVCAQERGRLISDLRQEIKAAQQPTWTAAEEAQRLENDFKEAFGLPAEKLHEFDEAFAELWKDATDFIQKPGWLLAACAVTAVRNWNAGVRDVAQLTQKWATARQAYTSGRSPYAPAAGTPIAKAAPPQPAQPAKTEGPSASMPVDCVRLNDADTVSDYGSFKNVCDFPVYFTYCGLNPKPGSWVADCNKGGFGLDGIAERGIQGGFTRSAEMIYMFACQKPKTPKDVRFIPGKGLYGSCK